MVTGLAESFTSVGALLLPDLSVPQIITRPRPWPNPAKCNLKRKQIPRRLEAILTEHFLQGHY